MGRYSGKTFRLIVMMFLTTIFFLVEITVGYLTNSIALIADSFHMLSDIVALLVGFASIRISKWPSKRNTYGWVRAEILGALVNSVFLLALCFSISVEALKRLFKIEKVESPVLLLIVGTAGLALNLIGLVVIGGHGHSHESHGHSHRPHGHGHDHKTAMPNEDSQKITSEDCCNVESLIHENGSMAKLQENSSEATFSSSGLSGDREIYVSQSANITIEVKQPKISSSQQLNMRGVFLHMLGDALGSVVVIISALIIWLAQGEWRFYVDPAMSIIMVIIILTTTLPLLKESAFILLQTAPPHVNVENIIKELEEMEGIFGVHECHIWQLAGNRIIASAHIRCHGIEEYMTLASKIKKLFHKAGIHSTTIQPEFIDWCDRADKNCVLLCDTIGDQCSESTCCGDKHRRDGYQGHRKKSLSPAASANQSSFLSRWPFNTNNSHPWSSKNSESFLGMALSPVTDEIVLEVSVTKAKDPCQGAADRGTNSSQAESPKSVPVT